MEKVDRSAHPCFNKKASGGCGRVHLPVAPKCNIRCNYCNRKYDCVNESRPGVTSGILKPWQAAKYMEEVLAKEPRITVAGIAGPGDPMANAPEVLETLRLIKKQFPHLLFCMSTNGLALPQYVDELADLDVSHVTVTMNAVDVEIGAQIYGWARDGKVVYRGREAAELMLERQIEGIRRLKDRGMLVKVNTIVIPGVNEAHIHAVADKAAELGADLMNLIPLHPTAGTPFADKEEPSRETIVALRKVAGDKVEQMTHCRRCRADAVGLLCKDRSGELAGSLRACSELTPAKNNDKPYVAVATREGMLVNQHLGEAKTFQIWKLENGVPAHVETRTAPPPGCGPKRWESLAHTLHDCRAVLSSAMGETPQLLLEEHGIEAHVVSGFIGPVLEALYAGEDLAMFRGRRKGLGAACAGTGSGCG